MMVAFLNSIKNTATAIEEIKERNNCIHFDLFPNSCFHYFSLTPLITGPTKPLNPLIYIKQNTIERSLNDCYLFHIRIVKKTPSLGTFRNVQRPFFLTCDSPLIPFSYFFNKKNSTTILPLHNSKYLLSFLLQRVLVSLCPLIIVIKSLLVLQVYTAD